MASARDQAARVVRSEPDQAGGEGSAEATAALADQLRSHLAEESRRRPGDAPAVEKPAPAAPPAAVAPQAAAAKPGRKRFIFVGFIALLALAGAAYAVYYTLVGRFYISTDDAYVRANNTMLGARVAGHIAAILPRDNALVHAGDVIFRIDDGDYKIAVDAARSRIATQQATIDRIGRQIAAQQAEAEAQLAELKTTLAKAERDLDFASVRTPVEGLFSNRLVNTGYFVALGQRLGNVVPLDDVYIDANYKETQLKRIRPGQPVTIKVDAYGFRKFKGTVDSLSPAAGSVFTLLPPDNATGNFTKIVQRVAVRIRVPKDVARQNLLRAGMSVYATVDTNKGAEDADNDTDLDASGTDRPQ